MVGQFSPWHCYKIGKTFRITLVINIKTRVCSVYYCSLLHRHSSVVHSHLTGQVARREIICKSCRKIRHLRQDPGQQDLLLSQTWNTTVSAKKSQSETGCEKSTKSMEKCSGSEPAISRMKYSEFGKETEKIPCPRLGCYP